LRITFFIAKFVLKILVMTTTAIREKLYGYIREADDDKIKNIYEIFEDQMAPGVDWSEDEEFVAELNERVRRLEEGIDKGVSIDEVKAGLKRLKDERSSRLTK
jgi:hypothetical protein